MRTQEQPLKYDPDTWPACWVLELIARNRLDLFYTSKRYWRPLREQVKREAKRLCYDCLHKSPAVINPIDDGTVHHIHPLRERPDLALSRYDEQGKVNLVYLCPQCHWDRHHKRTEPVTPERW